MKLIDKDALVAEIERLKDKAHNGVSYHQSRQNIGLENELSTWEHLENAFATVLKIINTLEVREVDLEKPFEGIKVQTSMESGSLDEIIVTTKYKAQKGEKL